MITFLLCRNNLQKLLCLILAIGLIVTLQVNMEEVKAEERLSMYAKSYCLTDGDTGRVLAGRKETDAMANASTTKILTCIITLENCDLNDMVNISQNAAVQPRVRLGMKEGEKYPLKDLLYGLMLESYNDCAVAIAEHMAGSVEEFSVMLNEKAKELGCKDTHFLTPNGLDKEAEGQFHHTTAKDLCRMMAYCTWESPKASEFLQITQTREYSGNAGGNGYHFVNRNAFLDQMEGVLSGKTGYTAKAGYCYVVALEQGGERYCVSLLACGWPNNKTYKWKDSRTLLTYGLNHFDKKEIVLETIEEIMTVEGYIAPPSFAMLNRQDSLHIYGEEKEYEVLLGEEEQVKKEIVLYTDTPLPIEKDQVLGQCNIYVEDMLLDSIPLKAKTASGLWEMNKIIEVILFQFLTFSS